MKKQLQKLISLSALTACILSADNALEDMTLSDFSTRGVSESGKPWLLTGSKAIIKGLKTNLTDVVYQSFTAPNEPDIRITSPACVYERTEQTTRSSEEVHVTGENFTLDGVGYDFYHKDEKLHIRSRVRMKIRVENQNDSSTGNTQKEEQQNQ